MGSRLPSEEEVLIIRPTGNKGQPPHRSNRVNPHLPEAPCQEARAFQSRIRMQCGPAECSLEFAGNTNPNSHFPKV